MASRLPVSIKKAFFDRKAIVSRLDRAERRVLSTVGFRVRQTSRKSLKPGPKKRQRDPETGRVRSVATMAPSRPNRPPHAHVKDGLRLIFFTYDKIKGSVVIGPIKFGGRGSRTVPNLHEFGGRGPRGGRYPKRPFMRPALERHENAVVDLWAEALK